MIPTFTLENAVLACHLTGIYDVNRNNTQPHNDTSYILNWAKSLHVNNVIGILFHNGFSANTTANFPYKNIQFIHVTYNSTFNPNVTRYFYYKSFLQENKSVLKNVFMTDVADVQMLQNPFTKSFYYENSNKIFCGDEPKLLQNDWMIQHGNHFRNSCPTYESFEETFKNEKLLNCGIIGGNVDLIKLILEELCLFHSVYNTQNKTKYTGDMGAFNYVIRTKFDDSFIAGQPVNTVFKNYETNRKDCWFSHK